MRVERLPLRRVRREIVVVVREGGDDEPVLVERRANALLLGLVEGLYLDVAGGEGPVPEARPSGELERFVAVGGGPRGDLLQAPLRHGGGEETELHVATAWTARLGSTSTHCSSRDEASTASVICAARRPSENVGVPSGSSPPRTAA